jgi:ferredoxin
VILIKKIPSIDLGKCSECQGCIAVAPTIFAYNASIGLMVVLEMDYYPPDLVEEAIKNCPEDCITWELSEYQAGKDR